jgi:hypothetical protein
MTHQIGNITFHLIVSLLNPFLRQQIHISGRLCWPGDLNKDPTAFPEAMFLVVCDSPLNEL